MKKDGRVIQMIATIDIIGFNKWSPVNGSG